jgi:hypothetical protein
MGPPVSALATAGVLSLQASVGWRVSEEAFMKGIRAISDLKIRGQLRPYGQPGISQLPVLADAHQRSQLCVRGSGGYRGELLKMRLTPTSRGNRRLKRTLALTWACLTTGLCLPRIISSSARTGMLVQVPLPNSVSFGLGGPFDNSTAIGPFRQQRDRRITGDWNVALTYGRIPAVSPTA